MGGFDGPTMKAHMDYRDGLIVRKNEIDRILSGAVSISRDKRIQLDDEREEIKKYFINETRTEAELSKILSLIKKHDVINVCKKRAEYFSNVSSDSLNIFKNSDIKKNLQELSFYLINRTN